MSSVFSNHLTVGADVVGEQKERFFPQDGNYGSAYVSNGEKTNASRNYSVYTADYLGTVNLHLPMGIGSTFSFGGQGFYQTEVLTAAIGKQFAGPGISTVSAASQTFGAEQYKFREDYAGKAAECRESSRSHRFAPPDFRESIHDHSLVGALRHEEAQGHRETEIDEVIIHKRRDLLEQIPVDRGRTECETTLTLSQVP